MESWLCGLGWECGNVWWRRSGDGSERRCAAKGEAGPFQGRRGMHEEAAVGTARPTVKVDSMSRDHLLHLQTMSAMWESITSGATATRGTAASSERNRAVAAAHQEKVLDATAELE